MPEPNAYLWFILIALVADFLLSRLVSWDLASALTKLAADHLANLTLHPLKVQLDHSHPPLGDRLAALRASRPR